MLFLAALAHAIVILGLSFGAGRKSGQATPGMEVLLVSDDLPEALNNEHAAYLAQRTQRGSGNTRTLPTGSPERRVEALDPAARGAEEEHWLTTTAPSPVILWLGQAGQSASADASERRTQNAQETLRGRGDSRELVLHGDAKTGQWVSADTKASRLAPYLDAWRRKVERVGTLNFPTAARRHDLAGSPVLEVALGSDGRLLEATVQRSSGHVEIDQAALQILKLASPFEPFPSSLTKNYSSLRFAYQYQWEFGDSAGAGVVTAEPNAGRSP